MRLSKISPLYRKLIKAAASARKHSHSPYSKYKVGAAALTAKGKIYTGCNVENVSYGLTHCAERVAIAKAISEGEKKITAIAIVVEARKPVGPCGACRQVIYEFGKGIDVLMATSKNKVAVEKISKLLPYGFDSSHLKNFLGH